MIHKDCLNLIAEMLRGEVFDLIDESFLEVLSNAAWIMFETMSGHF